MAGVIAPALGGAGPGAGYLQLEVVQKLAGFRRVGPKPRKVRDPIFPNDRLRTTGPANRQQDLSAARPSDYVTAAAHKACNDLLGLLEQHRALRQSQVSVCDGMKLLARCEAWALASGAFIAGRKFEVFGRRHCGQ
jgi:hypothetical protein